MQNRIIGVPGKFQGKQSFRAYAQVLPTVKLKGIIPRSELATDAKKKFGRNSTLRAQESALIPDGMNLQ